MKTLRTLTASLLLACLPCIGNAGTLPVAGLTFSFADAWTSVPPGSPMRAGTLKIPVDGAAQPLEAVFFYFGAGQGGDTDANVARWFKQFEGEPVTSREIIEVGGKKITLVKADGTYLDGPPMGAKTPKPGSTLLGAIVPAAEANVFIKLAGPKDAVAKISEDFKKLAASPFAKP